MMHYYHTKNSHFPACQVNPLKLSDKHPHFPPAT
jgi:hypothetical protein